jgi:uncharacterized protein (DUF362 family)
MTKLCKRRREFLKRSAGAAATLAVPGLVTWGCGGSSGGGKDGYLDAVINDVMGEAAGDGIGGDATPETSLPETGVVRAALGDKLTDITRLGMEAAKSLGIVGDAFTGSTVFIKPNFVTFGLEMFGVAFDPGIGECTKPELVAAVAEQCLEAGAARVVIGEGAQKASWEWNEAYFIPGNDIGGTVNLAEAVERLQGIYGDDRVELQCLNLVNEWLPVPSSSDADNVKDGVFVAKAFHEADHVISMPVIKTHQWAIMTASMKNYVGLVDINAHGNSISRSCFHTAYRGKTVHGVDDAGVSGGFVDIHKWRLDEGKEDFTIVDGTICMEGSGPHSAPVNDGQTIHMKDRNAAGQYFVLASNDFVAADVFCSQIIGIPEKDIKSLRMCRHLEIGAMDNARLDGASLDEIKIADWLPPVIKEESFFEPLCNK